jgi:hypothetical protein
MPLQGIFETVCNARREIRMENTQEQLVWVTPTLEVVGVSLECTAYAGANEVEE